MYGKKFGLNYDHRMPTLLHYRNYSIRFNSMTQEYEAYDENRKISSKTLLALYHLIDYYYTYDQRNDYLARPLNQYSSEEVAKVPENKTVTLNKVLLLL